MGKKVALVLIMVLFVNMVAWAEDNTDSEEDPVLVLAAIGIVVLVSLLVYGIVALVSEADAPDSGIRLASMKGETATSKTDVGTALDLLSHIEVGKMQNDKIYAGLRFQF